MKWILGLIIVAMAAFFFLRPRPQPSPPAEEPAPSAPVEFRSADSPPSDSASSAPAAKTSPNATPLLRALEQNDMCEIERLKNQSGRTTAEELAALAASISPSPQLAELLDPNGPILGSTAKAPAFKNPASRLIFALRKAGLRTGSPTADDASLNQAREMLLELEREDPTNSALPFYRFWIEEDLDYPQDTRRATLDKILAGKKFNLYLDDQEQELTKAYWKSPAHSLLVRKATKEILNVGRLQDSIYALSQSDLGVSKEQMMQLYTNMNGGKFDPNFLKDHQDGYDTERLMNLGSPALRPSGCDSSEFERRFYSTRTRAGTN